MAEDSKTTNHERQALLLLHAMMRQHSIDQFGVEPERTGCFDVVCKGLDGQPLCGDLEALGDKTTTGETKAAAEWLLGRDTGASSKALLARMLGADARPMNYPHDPSDISRCFSLLRCVPSWRSRISEMAECGPCWAALAERWDEIEAMMESEVGTDWSKGRSAPKTYQLMRSILMPVEMRRYA